MINVYGFISEHRQNTVMAKRKLNLKKMRTYEQEQASLIVDQLILSVALFLLACVVCCEVYDLFIEDTVTGFKDGVFKPRKILTKSIKERE